LSGGLKRDSAKGEMYSYNGTTNIPTITWSGSRGEEEACGKHQDIKV